MSEHVVIYHNPRCSKSRQALALLRDRGLQPEVIEYLKTPLDAADVARLIGLLGVSPHALLRTKEAPYGALGLHPGSSEREVSEAIAAEPVLMERPIVVVSGRAVIARPPERVNELL